MLRQLLSNGGGGGTVGVKVEPLYPPQHPTAAPLQPHPGEVLVKNEEGEKSLAVLSNMPPIAYYPQLQSAPSMMVRYPGDQLNDHISGTTELFSSTFAMLSGDGTVLDPEWAYRDEKRSCQIGADYGFDNNAVHLQGISEQLYANQQLHIAQPTFSQVESYGIAYTNGVHGTVSDEAQLQPAQSVQYEQHQKVSEETKPRKKERHSRSAQAHCISFREVAEIPLSSSSGRDTPGADGESEGDERVMCMACRGVYPSRRSLTGHIGRNEKCREIIGRSYLGQLNGASKVSIPGTSGAPTPPDALSPICPYCDRFISHYKGNIRRHVNQCMKCTRPKKKKSKRKTASSSSTPQTPMDCFVDGGFMPGGSQSNDAFYDGYQPHALSNEDWMSGLEESVSPALHPTPTETPDSKGPDDPYLCSLCDFITLYKGNMKRHLSTCHSIAEEEFQDGGLDSLRASRCAENPELLHNRVCKGRRAKLVLDAYDGRKRPKVQEDEGNGGEVGDASMTSDLASNDVLNAVNSEKSVSYQRSVVQQSHGQSTDISANGITGVGSSGHKESISQLEFKPVELPRMLSSLHDQHSDEERQVQEGRESIGITQSGDGAAKTNADASSASNIDEIINAVASNQLGSPDKKLEKGGTACRSASRRCRVPKTVRSMEEVRGYWEAERLNSGGPLPISSSLTGRSRKANFAGAHANLQTQRFYYDLI